MSVEHATLEEMLNIMGVQTFQMIVLDIMFYFSQMNENFPSE